MPKETLHDKPKMVPGVALRDVALKSAALKREETYRVYLPEKVKEGTRLPVVYLLHGAGDDYRSWSNETEVGRYALDGMVLVMPNGGHGYMVNAIQSSRNNYEDFFVDDLRADVEARFPVEMARAARAIVGISRGGYAAMNLGLRHPELYGFTAGISAAIDIPWRKASFRWPEQSLQERRNFGPPGSKMRNTNDPMKLIEKINPKDAPYLMLTCGEKDDLIGPNQKFVAALAERKFQHEFHAGAGGHDWDRWNKDVAAVFDVLKKKL